MAVKKKNNVSEEISKEKSYSLSQLLGSERFRNRRDLLKALLSNKKRYSISEVEQEIEKFMKGRVK